MIKILATALAVFACVSALAQDATKTIAIINGAEIKGDDYYRRMEYLPGVGTIVGTSFASLPPGLLTLNQLISETLLLQLADTKGVAAKDAEIEQYYRDALTQDPMLLKSWTDMGKTEADLKYQYKLEVTKFKLLTAGVNITDQQVQDEYTKNPTSYTIPKLVKLRVIVLEDDSKKAAVDADLAAGKQFADVAKSYSADITKSNGGEYGNVPIDTLPDPVKAAINATKIGATTAWIPVPNQPAAGTAVMKFLYVDAKEALLQPLDDKLKGNIRRKLMIDKGSVKNDLAQQMKEMRKTAKIDIKNEYFAKAFQELLNREAAAAPAAAPTAPAGN